MRKRITADDQVSNALGVELAQEIALILLHETRCLSAGELTVQVSAQLPGGLEALGGGPAAPVAVGLRLLLGEIGHLANGLVHGIAYLYYTGRRGRDLLGRALAKLPKSLMRMLSAEGNPQARNLFEMVAYLQKIEGTGLEVRAATAA